MSSLLFLGIAAALSLLGILVLWLRHRPPRSVDAQIRAFAKELEALSPDTPTRRPGAAWRASARRGRRPG